MQIYFSKVVRIYAATDTELIVQTTGPDDPASRELHLINVESSVQENSDVDDEQSQDAVPLRNSDFPVMESLTNIAMGAPGRKPCQYSEVTSANF